MGSPDTPNEKPPVGAEGFSKQDNDQGRQFDHSNVQKINKSPQFVELLGPKLLERGFLLTPILQGTKRPALKDWQKQPMQLADLHRYRGCGVGVLCGIGENPIVAVDIDVKQDRLAELLVAWCYAHLQLTVERVGAAPKSLLVFRAEKAGLTKQSSASFVDPHNPTKPDGKALLQKIELLGAGQQFVAYHIHPDTGRPYEWTDMLGGLVEISAASLPVLTQQMAGELLAMFENLALECGLTPRDERETISIDTPDSCSDLNEGEREQAIQRANEHTFADLESALAVLDASGRDEWVRTGQNLACFKGTKWESRARALFDGWSASASNHKPMKDVRKWDDLAGDRSDYRAIFKRAAKCGWINPNSGSPLASEVTTLQRERLDHFIAYLPAHQYFHRPTGQLFPASSVNSHLAFKVNGLAPSGYLDKNSFVHQMTWDPSRPEIIENEIVADGGWAASAGQRVYNQYRAPVVCDGDRILAERWCEHGRRLYPEAWMHLLQWFAHRVQRPGEKINHAIVLGGAQGIGKDSLLEPVKRAIGAWNFAEISPAAAMGRFNGFLKSVILRISEARDLGDVDRYAFYDHSKTLIAAPPDVLRVDEKHLREYSVVNCTGVIITLNEKANGIYLPADDRRHFVAWSTERKENFDEAYWVSLWAWFESGGFAHVAAYLRSLDLNSFNSKATPPKTEAWHAIVDANTNPEDTELDAVLRTMGFPPAVTLDEVHEASMLGDISVSDAFDRKNRRRIPGWMDRAGYSLVVNSAAETRFKVNGRYVTVYARSELSVAERHTAARVKLKGLERA